MVRAYVPDTGDLIKVSFDTEQAEHEQRGWRPAFVLSPRSYNKLTGLVVVAAITSQIKGYPFEVVLPPGLTFQGAVLSDQIRSLDWRARVARSFGTAPEEVLKLVRAKIAVLLGLPKP
jgi:mRNA interferase MazF